MKHLYLLALIFIFGIKPGIGQDVQPNLFALNPQPSSLSFIENKGQWNDQLAYMLKFKGGVALFEQGKIIYDFYRLPLFKGHFPSKQALPMGISPKTYHHAIFVEMLGANKTPKIEVDHKKSAYHNYFIGKNPARWASKVGLFGSMTYKDIYPGIDLRFFGNGNALKYEFLVEAGQDPTLIKLKYEGALSMNIKEGELHVKTSLGEIIEEEPIAFQMIDGERVEVPVKFVLQDNRLSFDFPSGYDAKKDLLIDPVLVFATHSGGSADNWGFTATYDSLGNAYGGGIEYLSSIGSTAYPTTPGAYDAVSAGDNEIAISKFSPDGSNLLYATYLGGSGEEAPHSLVVNHLNQLVVFGSTSSSNFPTTTGAYDNSLGGNSDIYVTRFTEDGTNILGSTYVGGNGEDGGNVASLISNYGDGARGEVIVDSMNNILVGSISSSANFPTSTGAYQTVTAGGAADGVLFQLNPDCSVLEWSTYYGGDFDEGIYSLKKLPNGNIVVVGGTSSTDLPVPTNAYQASYGGGTTDGYVAMFNSNATALLGASFLGATASDQTYLVDYDNNGDIYFTGQTTSSFWPIINPSAGPVYSNPGAGQFIMKMPPDLRSAEFSTVVGDGGIFAEPVSPTAFLVDDCGRIYFCGWGNTNNLAVTLNALQSTTDGEDFYLAVYEEDMQGLSFATFFGGNAEDEHVDGGTSRFDKRGVVYQAVCSSCFGTTTFPGTTGSYSPNSGISTACNMAVFKINLETFTIDANFEPLDTTGVPLSNVGCAPLRVDFQNLTTSTSLQAGFAYEWDFGVPGGSSTAFEPSFIFDTAGTFLVRLIVVDTISCREPDTAFQQIQVFPEPQITTSGDTSVCVGDTIQLNAFGPVGSYQWSSSTPILSNPNQVSILTSLQVTDSFSVRLTDLNGCATTSAFEVSVDPTGPIITYGDTVACYGADFVLNASTNWGSSYEWSSSPILTIQNANNPTALVRNLRQEAFFSVRVSNDLGCSETATFRVSNSGDSVFNEAIICEGESIQLDIPAGVNYQWSPGNSLDDPSSQNPIATPTGPTTYVGRANTTDGCAIVGEWRVNLNPLPSVDAGPDMAICPGDTAVLAGQGSGTPLWSPALALDSVDIFSPTANPPSSQTYSLSITNVFGCTASDQTELTVLPNPQIETLGDQDLCEGDSIFLLATGGIDYRWEPALYLSDPNVFNPLATPKDSSITYVVFGTDANGCKATDTVRLTLVEPPRTVLDWEPNCRDKGFLLTATGGEGYRWSTGETRPFIFVSPNDVETYSVYAINGECPGNTVSVSLDPSGLNPFAAFELDVIEGFVPYEVRATNLSQNAVSYLWSNPFTADFIEENPVFSIPDEGEHQIQLVVSSLYGCLDTAIQSVQGRGVWIRVPNAFSPNQDSYNDFFYAVSSGLESLEVQIFNRWGQLVFEDQLVDFRWDGNGPRGPVSEGVYVYKIKAIGQNGNTYNEVGTVTVVR